MKIMYDYGENEIRFGQHGTTGIWYCKEFTIKCKDLFDGVQISEALMIAVEEVLKERNKNDNRNKP